MDAISAGSAANVLVPETTDVSELFWRHEGDLHNIRQVFLMLWLISSLSDSVIAERNINYEAI